MSTFNLQYSARSKAKEPTTQQAQASTWSPLRHRLLRSLWTASADSNLGTWMHDVGAAWLMTSLSPSPRIVTPVQTATSLPVALLALPTWALADIADRRRLFILMHWWRLVVALGLALLAVAGLTTPVLLLLLTFAIGVTYRYYACPLIP
jgi:Transmembrane secretion effector